MKDLSWYIYEPLDWQRKHGYSVNMERCRYAVHFTGRAIGFHQCFRKATETVEGYGFCRQHAKMVRQGLGINEKEAP